MRALQAEGLVTVAAATTLWKSVVCALQVAGFVNVQLLAGAARHQHKVHGDGGLLAQARCTMCLSQVRIRLPAMPTSWGAPVRSVRWFFHIRFFTQLTCTCALAYRCTDGWSAAAAQLLEVFAGCWTPDAVSFGRLGHSCWLLTTFFVSIWPQCLCCTMSDGPNVTEATDWPGCRHCLVALQALWQCLRTMRCGRHRGGGRQWLLR